MDLPPSLVSFLTSFSLVALFAILEKYVIYPVKYDLSLFFKNIFPW